MSKTDQAKRRAQFADHVYAASTIGLPAWHKLMLEGTCRYITPSKRQSSRMKQIILSQTNSQKRK